MIVDGERELWMGLLSGFGSGFGRGPRKVVGVRTVHRLGASGEILGRALCCQRHEFYDYTSHGDCLVFRLLRHPQPHATRRSFLSHIKVKLSICTGPNPIITLLCRL